MTAPLDAATKRLRSMTPGQMADAVGAQKAMAAEVDEQLEVFKAEFVRRGIYDASGGLFDVTLTPPGPRNTLDRAALVADFGEDTVKARYTKTTTGTSYTLRCTARKIAGAASDVARRISERLAAA